MIETLLVGPDMYSVGGTQTVIRVMREHSIGADRLDVVSTWDGPNQRHNVGLVAKAARRIAAAGKSTIVHFHIANGGAWLREGALIRLARARGMRIVVTLHGYEFPEFARMHPRYVRSVLMGADHVICLSDEARHEVMTLLKSDRVTILANPVAVDHASPPADTTAPVVLFAGTVERRKGVDVLVEAWRQIVSAGTDGHCRIVGPVGDYVPPRLERMSVEAPVHPDSVGALVRGARVVVLPSRAEGMPMILTEALAAGRPFVATPVGGTRSITPDPGMLVPVDDPQALAHRLSDFLEDRALAGRTGRLGQQYIVKTRSPDVIDRRLREIYNGLG